MSQQAVVFNHLNGSWEARALNVPLGQMGVSLLGKENAWQVSAGDGSFLSPSPHAPLHNRAA